MTVVSAMGGGKKTATPATPSIASDATKQASAAAEYLLEQASAAWEKTDEKPAVLLAAGVAVVALDVLSSVVGTVDRLPFVGSFMELVGLIYSGYFIYAYLLTATKRENLVIKVKSLVKDVTGA